MVARPGEAARRGNALALRLLGWLMLLGAGLLLLALAVVLRLPVTPAGLAVPGAAGRSLSGAVVPILAAAGGAFATLGLASLLLGRRPPAHPLALPIRRGRAIRPAAILLGGLAMLAVALLRR